MVKSLDGCTSFVSGNIEFGLRIPALDLSFLSAQSLLWGEVCCLLQTKGTRFFPFSIFEASVLEVLVLQLLVRLLQLPEVLRSVLLPEPTTLVEAQTFPAEIVS